MSRPFSIQITGGKIVTIPQDITTSASLDFTGLNIAQDIKTGGNIKAENTSIFYFGDVDTDNSWRLVMADNNIAFQRRENAIWIEKCAITF